MTIDLKHNFHLHIMLFLAAWTIGDPDINCRLYKEKFSLFLSHCDHVAGPVNLENCYVDHPEDNSCEGLRSPHINLTFTICAKKLAIIIEKCQ